MREYLLLFLIASLLLAPFVYAARCPRPDTIPACATPAPVPYCRYTMSDSSNLCFMCHPHAYMGWMRPYYLRQKFIMEG